MGGISSRYSNTESNFTREATDIPFLDASVDLPGPITIPANNTTETNSNLLKVVNNEKQYHRISLGEMNTSLNLLLQKIQMNILANNYNEKNKVILTKLHDELNKKRKLAKDNKESNYADFRKMELIEKEIKEKKKSVNIILVASIVLFVLFIVSFLILYKN